MNNSISNTCEIVGACHTFNTALFLSIYLNLHDIIVSLVFPSIYIDNIHLMSLDFELDYTSHIIPCNF